MTNSEIYSPEFSQTLTCLRDFFASKNQEEMLKSLSELSKIPSNCHESMTNILSLLTSEESQDDAEHEFNRLFIGPEQVVAPLFSSVYLESQGILMGEHTVRIRHLMEELDLGVPHYENGGSIPEDFLSYELELLLILDTLMSKNQENVPLYEALKHEKLWLESHLKTWLPLFTQRALAENEGVKVPAIKIPIEILQHCANTFL